MASRHPNLHWPCHPHPPSVAPFSSFLSPPPHRDCATLTSQNCTLLLLPLCSTVSQPRHPHPSRITPLSSFFSSLLWHCHNHPFLPPLCPSSSPRHRHHFLTPPHPLFSIAPPSYSLKSIILMFHFFILHFWDCCWLCSCCCWFFLFIFGIIFVYVLLLLHSIFCLYFYCFLWTTMEGWINFFSFNLYAYLGVFFYQNS